MLSMPSQKPTTFYILTHQLMQPLVISMLLSAFAACEDNTDSLDNSAISVSSPAPLMASRMDGGQNTLGSPPIKCDRYFCHCNGKNALCTGRNNKVHHYLPQLPPEIRVFRMMEAKLGHLTRSMMRNLSNFELIVMNLTFNQITLTDRDTFIDFPKLRVLDLSGNPIRSPVLRASLQGISSPYLDVVYLWNMRLKTLPNDFFEMFRGRFFKKVDLGENLLTVLNSALFLPFLGVETVQLDKNSISSVNMSVRVNIMRLILKDNNLQAFPDLSLQQWPSRQTGASFHYLLTLSINGNPLRRIDPEVVHRSQLHHLRKLDISWSTLQLLEDNFISSLPKLEILMVNHMYSLRRYQRYALNSSSLRKLDLNYNFRLDRNTMDIPHVFRYCPNLESLLIIGTKIDMDTSEFFNFLAPLRSVKHINMQAIKKGSIPENLLWRLSNLESFVFTGGNLNSYSLGRALINVTSIRRLNVQGNGIRVVNESTLPWEFRRNLQWIDLSKNPFSCTCDLLWFRNWVDEVQKNGTVVVNKFDREYYRCRTPPELSELALFKFRPTAESCAVKISPVLLAAVLGGCLLVGLVVVLTLVYRYRWHLRYLAFRIRRREQYIQINGDERTGNRGQQMNNDMAFDVYLAHSPRDLDWITDELLPLLETEYGLHVFLEERDGRAGGVVSDNIINNMDDSARVMLLISDNYNREGWRQFEFRNILQAAIEQEKDVIVLLLGDVEPGRMPKDMRKLLTGGTFLQWGPSEEARRLFRDGLKVALKTQNVCLHTVC